MWKRIFNTDTFLNYTDEQARRELEQLRWPNGEIQCPRCHSTQPIYKQERNGVGGYYRCPNLHPSLTNPSLPDRPFVFTVRTDTILHRSHVTLPKWLYCLYLKAHLGNHKMSSKYLSGRISVTRKTASKIVQQLLWLYGLEDASDPNAVNNEFLLRFMASQKEQEEAKASDEKGIAS